MHHRFHTPRRHQCRCCGDHKAGWVRRGKWRARSDHELCMRCFRTELDRERARQLGERLPSTRRRSQQHRAEPHRLAA